jgi:hypothetical protein
MEHKIEIELFARALISTNCFSMIKKIKDENKLTDVQAKSMIFLLSASFKKQLAKFCKTYNPVYRDQEVAGTTWLWANDTARDLIAEILENALQLQILQFSTISAHRVEGFFIVKPKNVKILQEFLKNTITSSNFILTLTKTFKTFSNKEVIISTEDVYHEMESIKTFLTSWNKMDETENVDQREKEERYGKNEALENQLRLLLGVLNGSPDVFLFEAMFSSSMLSSIDRIINGSCTQYGTLYSNANVLFYKMYTLLQGRRQDDNSVLLLTGLAYQPSNFVQLHRKNESLRGENEELKNEVNKLKMEAHAAKISLNSQNAKRVNTAIVCQSLYLTNEMQKKNLDRVLCTLGLKTVPLSTYTTTEETDFKTQNDLINLQFLVANDAS